MLSEVMATIRALLYAGAAVFVVYMVVPLFHSKTPQQAPQSGPSATQEVNAAVEIAKQLANIHGNAPVTVQPAVAVIKDNIPAAKGLSDAEIATILAGLKPKTQQVVTASSKVIAPSPAPSPLDYNAAIYDNAYAADVAALNASQVRTDVHISQQGVPLSRLSTVILGDGDAGIGFDALRRGNVNATIGAVEQHSTVRPIIGVNYCLHSTSVCGGPAYEFGRGASVGITVHF